MRRALSLSFPTWSTDLARRRASRKRPRGRSRERGLDGGRSGPAFLLVDTIGGRRSVVHRCETAARAGVRRGMTLAHARALLHGRAVRVEPFDAPRDRAALERLAAALLAFSPFVATDPPDGLLLDLDGCERLFRGERAHVDAIVDRVEGLGIAVRAAVAGTIGCARALARFGLCARSIVPPGAERAALEPLPVEALRIDAETAEALREIGVERIEHLLALPREELPARFGEALVLQIDRALGHATETVQAIRPAPPPRVERVFDGPVGDRETLLVAARALLEELVPRLEERGARARRIDLELSGVDAGRRRIPILLGRATANLRSLWTSLRPKVERAFLDGEVERMALCATSVAPLGRRQVSAWSRAGEEDARTDRRLAEFLDALAERVSPERAVRAEIVESHVPERAFRLRPAPSDEKARSPSRAAAVTAGARPSALFDRPEPIDVVAAPDGSPSRFRWRGEEARVLASAGPERIAGAWWEGRSGARDYFRVRPAHGPWLWIYREVPSGRWFAHGAWA